MSQIVALRHNRLAFEQPLFQRGDGAREEIFQAIRDNIVQSKWADEFTSWGYIDQLRAALILTWLPKPWQGAPVQHLFVETVPGDIEAEEWLLGEVARRHAAIDDDFQVEIFGHTPVLWAGMRAMGFKIDAVKMIGQPQTALDGLRVKYGAAESAFDGLVLEPIESKKQVDEVVELQRRLYTDQPEYCWYGATSRSLVSTRINLRRRVVLGGDLSRLVLDAHGKVVGYFGATIDAKNALWGQTTSLDLMVASEHRGKGLGIAGYRFLLEAVIAKGAGGSAWIGRACHPAVLALGEPFARTLHSVTFRKQGALATDHFFDWVP